MSDTAARTRLALGQALKDELETTPLNRVTVRRLTQATGITRQAFYYHFADVYDLAASMTRWVTSCMKVHTARS